MRVSPHHPLAGMAKRRCVSTHPAVAATCDYRVVACSACWARVIAADAQFAAEGGLPAAPPAPDPWLVDDLAVERVVAGDTTVALTPAEQVVAAEQMRAAGAARTAIASRLTVSYRTAGLLERISAGIEPREAILRRRPRPKTSVALAA